MPKNYVMHMIDIIRTSGIIRISIMDSCQIITAVDSHDGLRFSAFGRIATRLFFGGVAVGSPSVQPATSRWRARASGNSPNGQADRIACA
jgi:hypothetical protein